MFVGNIFYKNIVMVLVQYFYIFYKSSSGLNLRWISNYALQHILDFPSYWAGCVWLQRAFKIESIDSSALRLDHDQEYYYMR